MHNVVFPFEFYKKKKRHQKSTFIEHLSLYNVRVHGLKNKNHQRKKRLKEGNFNILLNGKLMLICKSKKKKVHAFKEMKSGQNILLCPLNQIKGTSHNCGQLHTTLSNVPRWFV